jgi:hypothetical protein
MNFHAKQAKITAKHLSRYIYPGGVLSYKRKSALHPSLKRKNNSYGLNLLTPVDILETKWDKWGEPDEILYKSLSGINYVVSDDNLLNDISEFMKKNGFKGSLPYLHIEGENGWECYRRPAKYHILEFLRAYLGNYDIYSINRDLVQEANNERRNFNLCVDLD